MTGPAIVALAALAVTAGVALAIRLQQAREDARTIQAEAAYEHRQRQEAEPYDQDAEVTVLADRPLVPQPPTTSQSVDVSTPAGRLLALHDLGGGPDPQDAA